MMRRAPLCAAAASRLWVPSVRSRLVSANCVWHLPGVQSRGDRGQHVDDRVGRHPAYGGDQGVAVERVHRERRGCRRRAREPDDLVTGRGESGYELASDRAARPCHQHLHGSS